MKEILVARNIKKDNILFGIDFAIREGEMVAVMGPSGSGKSTFLYQVSGMDVPDEGEVIFDGEDITKKSEDERADIRLKSMGFVFQQMNVLPNLNIIDNVMLPASQLAKRTKASSGDLRKKAEDLLEMAGIGDLAERKITEVSGGQLQRACICRSLMNDPEILFADEPTGALNKTSSEEIMAELKRLNEKRKMTTMIVTHDSSVAEKCDRVIYIIDGKIAGEYYKNELSLSSWLNSMGW